MQKLKVAWLSAGVSSFIATYLANDSVDEIYYIDIDDQHEDSMRFVLDCEKALQRPIKILKSPLSSVENAVLTFGGFKNAGTGFYPCTGWLKKRVRLENFELLNQDKEMTYIWGFDYSEINRAVNMEDEFSDFKHLFPLIDKQLTKQDCHAMLKKMNIKRPYMYDLGYNNNNCICCVKGGMGYLNKCRKDFPKQFKARAELERKVGYSILKDCYLDELDPNRGDMSKEIMQDCGIMCELALHKNGD